MAFPSPWEGAPWQRLRLVGDPIVQNVLRKPPPPAEVRPDEETVAPSAALASYHGASPAFLSRFVVLQAIGAAGIVGLWIEGIADKPFAGNNAFLCWLIASIGALG